MNGPQHYAEAERLVADFPTFGESRHTGLPAAEHIALAQVHATLALAAATVAGRAFGPLEGWGGHHIELLSPEREAWEEVTS